MRDERFFVVGTEAANCFRAALNNRQELEVSVPDFRLVGGYAVEVLAVEPLADAGGLKHYRATVTTGLYRWVLETSGPGRALVTAFSLGLGRTAPAQTLKLFVWDGEDIPPEYFGGMAVALAHNLHQARRLLRDAYECEFIDRPPDRIIEAPAAVFQVGVLAPR